MPFVVLLTSRGYSPLFSSHQSYAQELPRRFRKDIVDAATKRSSSISPGGIVSAAGIEHVLSNIGAADKMTHDEIEMMLREVGSEAGGSNSEDCVISADKMLDLLSNRVL